MSEQLKNIRAAYLVLLDRVHLALRTQLGDVARLSQQRDEAVRLLEAAEQLQDHFPPAEFSILQQSLAAIVNSLDQARHESADPPDEPQLVVVTRKSGGRPGRPRVEIDPTFLREALALRGPSGLKPIFNCDARTVRQRALEYGIATPGTPVFVPQMQPDGVINAMRSTSTRGISALTNDKLDALLSSILEIFPTFGQRMIAGRLKASGHHVPRERITESFLRHAFVDGKSRLVARLRINNNNRAETVLITFHEARAQHGTPSRLLSGWRTTEDLGGARISGAERMWYDITHGFGMKWKNFFLDLEVNHGLNPQSSDDSYSLT
ncbi:uncharacterized protein LACBIDRAFT_324608 [Laccaria bicolor S238N-H82]|uniref:Predicted protein n=1 Tax=Laccaria bicolor (strain S238N-H82 / ATCC MYA-4686) TaxID=486041 RepID=B0D2G2_LACBS|nr:uncharacterized protein LACBIDRAFT_324608 [Laccaria bicolor S238N-H82]EDR10741.1 predicted protein [Laccaria bicolor S238N-H82]|eukprot:XP_001878042.1 predicted protein [Laccaria bicolor S238N-H82]